MQELNITNNNALQVWQPALPLGSLEAYIHSVHQIPMLSAEEELDYATRWQESGDIQAAQKLVLAHLRYVVRIARSFKGYGLALNDLIQEGTVGLMKAVKRFDPTKGVRLVTLAMYWIKAEVHEFVLRNWRIVKVATTKAQRKLFFNLRSAKKGLGWLTSKERSEVAADLNVKVSDVECMEQRLSAVDDAYDLPLSDSDPDTTRALQPAEYLAIENNPAQQLEQTNWLSNAQGVLHIALAKLDLRSRDIISKRWLQDKKSTLKELAEIYGVSLERIRQLEKQAMQLLQVELAAEGIAA